MRTIPALSMTIGNYLHRAMTKLRSLPWRSFSLTSGLSWLLGEYMKMYGGWSLIPLLEILTCVHRSCRVLKGLLVERY